MKQTTKGLREFRKQMVMIEQIREENNYYRTKNEHLGHSYARDEALERNLKLLELYSDVYEQEKNYQHLLLTIPYITNRERTIFEEYYFHGKEIREICDKYYYSERRVYYILRNARRHLGIDD